MQFLKADTAATVLIGPFLDMTNGVTPEAGITLGAADAAEIMKHDGTTFTDISALTFTHKQNGMYTLAITAAHLNIEGRLTVFISDESVCLPVWAEFMVVNANVYDSLFAAAATDYLQVDGVQSSGTSQTANDNGADINTILSRIIGTLATGTHNAQGGDAYAIVNHASHGNAQLVRSTAPANALDVSATGEAGLDFANIKNATGAHTLTNITIPTCSANTDMRGTDSAALASTLGSAVGASISADIADIPTVSEFNARSIPTADYVVTSDTIAGVTAVSNDVGITQAGADKVWGTAARALTDKAGFALSAAGNNAIWDATEGITGDAHSFEKILATVFMFLFHEMNITDATGAMQVRNTGDTGNVITATITDNDTTTNRTKATIP